MHQEYLITLYFFQNQSNCLKISQAQVKCDWKHKENDFNDFNVQYLIPHQESTRGPKLAVADVNKDGLDDFYVVVLRASRVP